MKQKAFFISRLRLLATYLTAATLLVAVIAYANDLAGSFEQAAALADAQERAAPTKAYFANTLLPYYAGKYAPVLKSCFASLTKPDNRPFSFVVAIGADGRMLRLYSKDETNILECLQPALQQDVFPVPPEWPYYLHIDMKINDEDVPAAPPRKDAPPLIVEPNKYSYTFGLPKDWEFSFEQAQQRGAVLAFFPKGGSFNDSKAVIYVNEIDGVCRTDCKGSMSRAVSKTLRESREESPNVMVSVESPIKTKDGGTALVRILRGGRDPRQADGASDYEAIAFIEHKEAIVLVVLTAKNPDNWEQDYSAFRAVVSGHRFFTCNTSGLAVPCKQ